MKRIFVFALAAVMVLLSCQNKETPDQSGQEQESELSDQNIFWGVVGQLVDQDDITPDYKGKTFKPIIGTPDGGDESVRVVSVSSLKAAVDRYNTLTDAGITETTSSHTWQDKNVGSLIWNLGDGSICWATVDVSIPSVPSLKKIIYRSAEQGDVNGSVGNNGSAYYRFGDVLKRVREDGVTEYWICVRPAFGPQGKGKAHFVSVSPLPEDKVWPYNSTDPDQAHHPFTASNQMDYGLPENIGKETEWTQDLVEMLYAIIYPTAWYSNIKAYSTSGTFGGPDGLPIFNGFHVKNIEYHNEYFWRNVQSQWKEKDLVQKIFGISYADMEAALSTVNPTGLHFLYYTSAWNIKYSNTPKLYQVHYTHGSSEVQKNMHKETKKTVSHQVVVPRNLEISENNFPFNIRTETTQDHPYVIKNAFFGDSHPRWIVRYMTGEELSLTGAFDNQQPIPGFHSTNEVYRYYKDVYPEKNLLDAPEVSTKDSGSGAVVNGKGSQNLTTFSGTAHYHLGDVLRDQDGNNWFVVRPSGDYNNKIGDNSPYTELVSFQGITFSADGKTATNIVTRDQALRVTHLLWYLSEEYQNADKRPVIFPIYGTLRDNVPVLLEQLLPRLIAPRHNKNENGEAFTCSVAYYEPGSTNQHLLRYITSQEQGLILGEYDYVHVMYDKYPVATVPNDNTYVDIKPEEFSNTYIYLQDVADQQMVNQYGSDCMAHSPLYTSPEVPRPYRQNTEPRAAQATGYTYNMNTWANDQQPLGMWNEPVLLLRAKALYDRGTEYATVAHDGTQFTMVSRGTFLDQPFTYQYEWLEPAYDCNQDIERYLNGNMSGIPRWQAVWGQ